MKKASLILIFLTVTLSRAQVGSGTIIVLDFAKDKLAIAADSRVSFDDRPPQDTHCKIEVFRHRIVFTNMGAVMRFKRNPLDASRSWDNSELARRAVREMGDPAKDPDTEIKDIASIWASSLAVYWRSVYQSDRELIDKAAKNAAGIITSAVFAEARNGSIHWRTVAVGIMPDMTPSIQAFTGELHDCWPCGQGEKVCAMARPAIPEEFCTQSSQRAKDEAAQWAPSPELAARISRETLHAIRLVDNTIAFDPIRGLGGNIDALELRNDGTINWVFRKDNCPENED
jgi:hypothetical protein